MRREKRKEDGRRDQKWRRREWRKKNKWAKREKKGRINFNSDSDHDLWLREQEDKNKETTMKHAHFAFILVLPVRIVLFSLFSLKINFKFHFGFKLCRVTLFPLLFQVSSCSALLFKLSMRSSKSSSSSATVSDFAATCVLALLLGNTFDVTIRQGVFAEFCLDVCLATICILLIKEVALLIGWTLSSVVLCHEPFNNPFKHDSTLPLKFQDTVSSWSLALSNRSSYCWLLFLTVSCRFLPCSLGLAACCPFFYDDVWIALVESKNTMVESSRAHFHWNRFQSGTSSVLFAAIGESLSLVFECCALHLDTMSIVFLFISGDLDRYSFLSSLHWHPSQGLYGKQLILVSLFRF